MFSASPSSADPPPAGPDGSTLQEDTRCPRCDYSLTGLTRPRCPECGYASDWPHLLDPALRLHPYAFEHHPEQNAKSFCRTVVGTLLPRRFWKSLYLTQPANPGRLVAYWFIAATVYLIAVFFVWLIISLQEATGRVARRSSIVLLPGVANALKQASPEDRDSISKRIQAAQDRIDGIYPAQVTPGFIWRVFCEYSLYFSLLGCLLLWPWLTFVILQRFGRSQTRAGVSRQHVLRCVVYSFDFVFWVGLALLAAIGICLVAGQSLTPAVHFRIMGWTAPPSLVLLVVTVTGTYRLCIAYTRYLRFDHPVVTIIASQTILLLAVILFLVALLNPLLSLLVLQPRSL